MDPQMPSRWNSCVVACCVEAIRNNPDGEKTYDVGIDAQLVHQVSKPIGGEAPQCSADNRKQNSNPNLQILGRRMAECYGNSQANVKCKREHQGR